MGTLERREGPDGEVLFVAPDEAETGSEAPFYAAYLDTDREAKWGYFCAHCATFDNAMDAMGAIQCNRCGNFKRPDEWDSAHE